MTETITETVAPTTTAEPTVNQEDLETLKKQISELQPQKEPWPGKN